LITIVPGIEIPESELEFVASRSGGPGGQNVNKVSSRITLRFDVERSSALNPDQRRRIRAKLASRISKDGVLQVSSQRTRSQDLNREEALLRFTELLREAMHEERPRVKTKASRQSQEERLHEKRKRTEVKNSRSNRGKIWDE